MDLFYTEKDFSLGYSGFKTFRDLSDRISFLTHKAMAFVDASKFRFKKKVYEGGIESKAEEALFYKELQKKYNLEYLSQKYIDYILNRHMEIVLSLRIEKEQRRFRGSPEGIYKSDGFECRLYERSRARFLGF
jgi:hypothetical protein